VSDTVSPPAVTKFSVDEEREVAVLEKWMENTPLLRERPRQAQIVLGLIVPTAFGAIAGIVLGITAAGYWAINLLALAGGVAAGFEHSDGWEGADRGLVGGSLFGLGILVAHGLAGSDAQVELPGFAPVLIIFTAIFGMLAGALGGRLRRAAIERSGAARPQARGRTA
jgi:hypothetical protein